MPYTLLCIRPQNEVKVLVDIASSPSLPLRIHALDISRGVNIC